MSDRYSLGNIFGKSANNIEDYDVVELEETSFFGKLRAKQLDQKLDVSINSSCDEVQAVSSVSDQILGLDLILLRQLDKLGTPFTHVINVTFDEVTDMLLDSKEEVCLPAISKYNKLTVYIIEWFLIFQAQGKRIPDTSSTELGLASKRCCTFDKKEAEKVNIVC